MSDKNLFGYAKNTSTKIFYEKPLADNPYVSSKNYIYGYDVLELANKKSFLDVLFLLFTGELPNSDKSALLNALLIGLINPGPRNPAVRAAMTAGISKSNPEHLLPIGLMVLGGEENGAKEVEKSMLFLQQHENNSELFSQQEIDDSTFESGDVSIAPGFGSTFSQRCPICHELAESLASISAENKYLNLVHQQIKKLDSPHFGWRVTGIAAAAFLDLGIGTRESIGLFQLITAPGITAHAFEQTHKPLSSMPFLEDSQYELRR